MKLKALSKQLNTLDHKVKQKSLSLLSQYTTTISEIIYWLTNIKTGFINKQY